MTSIMVVLPAPFGPMMQRSSPGSICSVSSLSALKPSKLTVSLLEMESFAASAHFLDGSGAIGLNSAAAPSSLVFLTLPDTRPMIPRGRNSVTSTNNAPSA